MDKALDLATKRICVTGGAGFLGTHLIRRLKEHGAREIFVPQYPEYDLVREADIIRMIDTAKPDIIIHLGIIFNRIESKDDVIQFYWSRQEMIGISRAK